MRDSYNLCVFKYQMTNDCLIFSHSVIYWPASGWILFSFCTQLVSCLVSSRGQFDRQAHARTTMWKKGWMWGNSKMMMTAVTYVDDDDNVALLLRQTMEAINFQENVNNNNNKMLHLYQWFFLLRRCLYDLSSITIIDWLMSFSFLLRSYFFEMPTLVKILQV